MKTVLRGRLISWGAFNKRSRNQQINDLTLQLKALEKKEQTNTKSSRRQEIVKIRAEINEIETKETIGKINKINSWFFEKINKIDKPLATLTKRKGRKLKLLKLGMNKDISQQTRVKYKI